MKLKWTSVEQKSLDGIKPIITRYILLVYSHFNKCFDIKNGEI